MGPAAIFSLSVTAFLPSFLPSFQAFSSMRNNQSQQVFAIIQSSHVFPLRAHTRSVPKLQHDSGGVVGGCTVHCFFPETKPIQSSPTLQCERNDKKVVDKHLLSVSPVRSCGVISYVLSRNKNSVNKKQTGLSSKFSFNE